MNPAADLLNGVDPCRRLSQDRHLIELRPALETRQRGFANPLRQSLDSARELQARLQQTVTKGKADLSTN
jgi:hypothetical protein